MMKPPVCIGALLLLVQMPAFAFGGCADSPENPSLVLALLGGGAAGMRYLWQVHRARRAATRSTEREAAE